jgi:hypothetical protein
MTGWTPALSQTTIIIVLSETKQLGLRQMKENVTSRRIAEAVA